MRQLSLAALGLIAGLAAPGAAFEIDYAAIFRQHDGELREVSPTGLVPDAGPGIRRLELPGPLVIEEVTRVTGEISYVATDQSGRGAAGCGFALLLDLVVLSGLCEDMLSPPEHAALEAHLWRVARFVGENAYPRVARDALRPAVVVRLQARREAYRREGGAICPQGDAADQGLAEMARNLGRAGGRAAIDRLVGQPRLPVMEPCSTR